MSGSETGQSNYNLNACISGVFLFICSTISANFFCSIAPIEKVPAKYFKYIEDSTGLYEIRVEFGGKIFRVFSFFDKGRLVILINSFQKKSQQTPKKEIERAEKLKKQYFDEKNSK